MKRTILVFGKSGQVGRALERSLTGHHVISHDRSSCDLASPDNILHAIRAADPHVVVNAAAYTAVDQAETDEAKCRQINADAPRVMAEEAARRNILFVHYSTDYVFDGSKRGTYSETDQPNPINAYGRTKLDGDHAVMSAGGPHILLRVGWVYSSTGRNFAKTILRLAGERDELNIVSDQFGAPTSASLISSITATMTDRYLATNKDHAGGDFPSGLYHLAPRGQTSWHGFATELVKEAGNLGHALQARVDRIKPIPSTNYPTPARRPGNSSLDTGKLERSFNFTLPDWREHIAPTVSELMPVTRT